MPLRGLRIYSANCLLGRGHNEQFSAWKADYAGMRKEMFYGEVPEFDDVMDAVSQFQDRFNGKFRPANG